MAQEFFKSISIDDFIKDTTFTLLRPSSPKVLGQSAIIKVEKTDDGLQIYDPVGLTPFLKNFKIEILDDEDEEKKFICNFNWEIIKQTNRYRLYKNNSIIYENFNNCFKYDFSQEPNGIYNFKVDCLYKSNFIQKNNHSTNIYTYPFLDIPIDYNYKYYFYYYIENLDEDFFMQGMLTPIAVDEYGASLMKKDKAEWVQHDGHCWRGPMLDWMEDKGCYVQDTAIYFSRNDKSYEGYPFTNIVLELNKITGMEDTEPIINKIDIFIEKIDAEEGE